MTHGTPGEIPQDRVSEAGNLEPNPELSPAYAEAAQLDEQDGPDLAGVSAPDADNLGQDPGGAGDYSPYAAVSEADIAAGAVQATTEEPPDPDEVDGEVKVPASRTGFNDLLARALAADALQDGDPQAQDAEPAVQQAEDASARAKAGESSESDNGTTGGELAKGTQARAEEGEEAGKKERDQNAALPIGKSDDEEPASEPDHGEGGAGKPPEAPPANAGNDDPREDPVDRELRDIIAEGAPARDAEPAPAKHEAAAQQAWRVEPAAPLSSLRDSRSRIVIRMPDDMLINTSNVTVNTRLLSRTLSRAGAKEGQIDISFIPADFTDVIVLSSHIQPIGRDVAGEEELYFLGYPSGAPEAMQTGREVSVIVRINREKFDSAVARTILASPEDFPGLAEYAFAKVLNEVLNDLPAGVIQHYIYRFYEKHDALPPLPKALYLTVKQALIDAQNNVERRIVGIREPD